jgi:hypothetical protein
VQLYASNVAGRTVPAAADVFTVLHENLRDLDVELTTFPCQPVAVDRAVYEEMFAATRQLLQLLKRAVLKSAPTSAGRVAALGADDFAYPMFVDGPVEERYCDCIARPDVVLHRGVPKFLEFNVGGAVGGPVQIELFQRAWMRIFDGPRRRRYAGYSPFSARAALFDSP